MEINKNIIEKAKAVIGSDEFINKLKSLAKPLEKEDNDINLHIDEGVEIDESLAIEFVDFCLNHLNIKDAKSDLTVVLSSDKEKFTTFAFYDPSRKLAAVYSVGRAVLDIFRSLAHEIVHFKQDIKGEITDDQVSGENDGVPIEDEANSVAGVIMRKFGRNHKELY